MAQIFQRVYPRLTPPLDPEFQPAALVNRDFQAQVAAAGGVPLVFGVEQLNGVISRFATHVFPAGHPQADANLPYAERIFKFLLWQRGGWRVYVGGPPNIGAALQTLYAPGGAREFDAHFMGEDVYSHPFTVVPCAPEEVPPARESGRPLGRHLEGYRIGFDLGASDRKVSAVVDGEAIYSEEVVWEPSIQSDPDYHYREIMASLRAAAAKLPRVDAIGGSAAGVYVDNQVRVASLFRGVPKERYDEVRNLFLRIRDEMGAPLEIINDGDVTALAGAMSLEDNGVLGIALGSSQAAGYVALDGTITGWLNELAFVPIDLNPDAMEDEWSLDRGCGVKYFSQDGVIKLAPEAGIELDPALSPAEKLKVVQKLMAGNDPRARAIYETLGVNFGYAIAYYALFYDIRHVLVMGRVTSGDGGVLLLNKAREVLRLDFPELAEKIELAIPDEHSRRVGQSVAAASLAASKNG